MNRRLLIAASLLTVGASLLFSRPVFASDAKQKLESQFQKKVFFIRGFYRDDELVYDAAGNIQGTPAVGSWTLGLVEVKKVEVRSDEFVLQGKRAAEFYDLAKKQFENTLPKKAESVQITVKVPTDNLSDATLDVIRDRIFETQVGADEVPDYWQYYFGKSGLGLPGDKPNQNLIITLMPSAKSGTQQSQLSNQLTATTTNNGFDGDAGKAAARAVAVSIPTSGSEEQSVFRPGVDGVTPPKILYNIDPIYEELARQAGYHGISVLSLILDKQGVPQHIQVVRALGMGLDDNAVDAVRTWRFSPATRNGAPVAVLITVEVAFRLY